MVSDYAKVQGILIGVVAAFVLIVTIIGPECVPPFPSLLLLLCSSLLFFTRFPHFPVR